MGFMDKLVSGKELIGVKKRRSQSYIFEKFEYELQEKRESEGWIVDKELKSMVRMKRPKPLDRQFEDDVWCLFSNLGFSYMNKDRRLEIPYGTEDLNTTKQIDVFAADEETVLFIECKCAFSGKKGDFKTDLEAIKGIKEGLFKTVRREKEFKKKKVKYIFATKNYEITEPDRNRMRDLGIYHFDEYGIKYFAELAKHLGACARYQLLGTLFAGQKIGTMENRIPAIEGQMGGHTYYSFSIEPEKLLKLAYVLHRNEANSDMMPTYQRIIKKQRLKEIRKFIDNKGFFPNSLIIDIMYGKRGGGNWATDNDYCDIYDPYQPEKGDTVPKSIKKKAKLYTVFYKNNWGTVGSMDIGSWLSAFSTQLIKAGDDIFEGLENIAEIIVNQAQAWILTDPMGEYIDFGDNTEIPRVTEKGEEGDYTVAFNTSTNTLVWNLRNDTSRTGPVDGWYTYKLTYSVTLDTLKSGFSKENQYATNGNTVLTYMLTEDGELQPQLYKTELLVPMVKGFAGDLIFTKKGSDGKILEGAQFTLTCQDNGNWKREATSDKSGKISFTDIPSGHVYTLAETKVPGGYVAVKPIDVTVSYGEVTAKEITDGTLIDPVATGSLAISKTVTAESGLEADSDQEFTFTVDFNGKDVLKGEFPYTVSGSETGNGNVTDGATITLKAGETATITGLPVGTTYTVTCLLYTSPSPRDRSVSRMPSSA